MPRERIVTLPSVDVPAKADVTLEFEGEDVFALSLSCGPVQVAFTVDADVLLDIDVQVAGQEVSSVENLEMPMPEQLRKWVARAEEILADPT